MMDVIFAYLVRREGRGAFRVLEKRIQRKELCEKNWMVKKLF